MHTQVTMRAAGMPDLILEAGVRVKMPPHKDDTSMEDDLNDTDAGQNDINDDQAQPQYAYFDVDEEVSCCGNRNGSEAVAVCSKKQTIGVPSKSAIYTGDNKESDDDDNGGTNQGSRDRTIPGDAASAWFSTLLGTPAALLRASDLPTSCEKKTSSRDASIVPRSDTMINAGPSSNSISESELTLASPQSPSAASTTFSNEAPFLLISSRSVSLLNQAMNRALPQNNNKNSSSGSHEDSDCSRTINGTSINGGNTQKVADKEEEPPEVELVTARNFRPNLVVGSSLGLGKDDDGFATPHHQVDAHAEDQWASLAIGCSSRCSNSLQENHNEARSTTDDRTSGNDNVNDYGKSHSTSSNKGRNNDPCRGVRFVALGDCARCAMVDVHYPESLDEKAANDDDVSSNASKAAKSEVARQHRTSALRTLASYRRRHAQIVFGRYLAALPPLPSPSMAPSSSPLSPSLSGGASTGAFAAADDVPNTRRVLLQWIAEGDEIEPLCYGE
jgi:hypothetical protein